MNASNIVGAIRPGNCIISAAGVYAGYAVAAHSPGLSLALGMAMLSAYLVTGAGNAINDYFDTGIDTRLGKRRVEDKNALLWLSATLFAAGLLAASTLPLAAFGIAAAVSALLIIYSGAMQKAKYIGNIVVALGTALTLVFGAALTGNPAGAMFIAAAAFFANVGREIIKDAEDIEGDIGGKRTIPMMMGQLEVKKIVFLVYMGAIASGITAFLAGSVSGTVFLVLFGISAMLFLDSFRLFSEKMFGEAQRHSKYGMVAALAAFLAGVL